MLSTRSQKNNTHFFYFLFDVYLNIIYLLDIFNRSRYGCITKGKQNENRQNRKHNAKYNICIHDHIYIITITIFIHSLKTINQLTNN
jgi:hypothetical protein